jgi:AraC-like DNA-binding protein
MLVFKYEILFNQWEDYMARKDIHAIKEWPAMARQAAYRAELLANRLKICPRQLQRYTQEIFGYSPQRWLNEQRLSEAAVMLRKDHLIKTVALDLGFKCVSHFSREFKLRYGVPPSQFQVWSKIQTSQLQNTSAKTQQQV